MGIADTIRGWFTPSKPKQEVRGFTYTEGVAAGLILEPVDAGVAVSNEKALQISAVYAAVRHVSESLSSLPKRLLCRQPDGGWLPEPDHPAHVLVACEPCGYMTSVALWEWFFTQCVVYSNGFLKIVRNGAGRPTELHPLPSPYVLARWDVPTMDLSFQVLQSPYTIAEELDQSDVIHVMGLSLDGILGLNPMETCRQSHGLSLALEKFAGSFIGKGARPSGVLEKDGLLSDTARKNLKESWSRANAGPGQAGGTPVLEDGLTWKPLSVNPSEAQALESRQHQIGEASRFCKVPQVKLDPTRATWANLVDYNAAYIQESLAPWAIKLEQELDSKLLMPSEKGKYRFEVDFSGLLRGDKKTRYSCYGMALAQSPWLTVNEARAMEGMPPLEGGDVLPTPVGSTVVPDDKGQQLEGAVKGPEETVGDQQDEVAT